MLREVLEHALKDTINILPFLFLTYLVMEYIQHKIGKKKQKQLQRLNQYGPAVGSFLGIFPQCGFSSVASSLYVAKMITLGTLISIYLATSDEMLPILIAEQVQTAFIIKILLLKIGVGFLAGTLIDYCTKVKNKGNHNLQFSENIHHEEQNATEEAVDFTFRVYKESEQEQCYCCKKGGLLLAAIRHTFSTVIFLFLISTVLTFVIHGFGEEKLADFILNRKVIGEVLAGIIGLIPNCAASVVLTELYLEGGISFSALMSGLFTGSGVGILVLLRENRKNWKNSLKIIGLLYGVGVIAGWILGIAEWIA